MRGTPLNRARTQLRVARGIEKHVREGAPAYQLARAIRLVSVAGQLVAEEIRHGMPEDAAVIADMVAEAWSDLAGTIAGLHNADGTVVLAYGA